MIRKLREADRLLGEGADVAEVAGHLEVSEQAYHRCATSSRHEGRRRKAPEGARAEERPADRLKRIVVDKELEIDARREISRENG